MSLRDGRTRSIFIAVVLVVLAGALVAGWTMRFLSRNRTPVYSDVFEHFKYASIGTEARFGLPAPLWKALPDVFPDLLPPGPGKGWERLGLLYEPGHELPIGTSVREKPIPLIGLNCAVCHMGTIRDGEGAERRFLPGAPSNNLNSKAYLTFLFTVGADPRFDPAALTRILALRDPEFGFFNQLFYRYYVLPQVKSKLADLAVSYGWIYQRPDFGPGRVDTFNPYKGIYKFDMTKDDSVGTADFPAIFNQRIRQGMWLHWDSNNNSMHERNLSAAIGAGADADSLDVPAVQRVEDWILDLQPPAFPVEKIDKERARRGHAGFDRACAQCHAVGGARVGNFIPIEEIKTDRERLDSFTPALVEKLNQIGVGKPWRFSHFRKTNGYAAAPLDGVWVRSPYLHNGSVPTLRQLLFPEERPAVFQRGYDVFDYANVGYVSAGAAAEKSTFRFDTAVRGNHASGHLYGGELPAPEREDLLEYLKTL